MNEKILFVDDEILVLSAFQRQLRKQFQISAALGGEQALKVLATDGPFAVVVSDLKMRGMDGIQLLARVREISPDSVRVMLTGQADLSAAAAAVNEGRIFRFLTKPCPIDTLAQTLTEAAKQHNLIVAEKDLLGKTLRGCVKVLTEILSIVHPAAFGRSSRVRQWVRKAAAELDLNNQWSYELAALLSQIGCITLPADVLDKACSGEELTAWEREIFATHPGVGSRLIADIPRLELVARMVERQLEPYAAASNELQEESEHQIEIGAQLLSAAIDFDYWLSKGLTPAEALARLRDRGEFYNPKILNALEKVSGCEMRQVRESCCVRDLKPAMIAEENIRTYDGALLLAKGLEISVPALECLRRFAAVGRVHEPIRVLYEVEVTPEPETPELDVSMIR